MFTIRTESQLLLLLYNKSLIAQTLLHKRSAVELVIAQTVSGIEVAREFKVKLTTKTN